MKWQNNFEKRKNGAPVLLRAGALLHKVMNMNVNDSLEYMRTGLPEDILQRKLHGDYEGAVRLIDKRLKENNLSDALRGSLLVQKKICQELPGEFPYSKEDAMAIIRKDIPDFTEAEFEELVDQRNIRWIYINGEEHYSTRFYDSLCKAVPEFGKRARQQMGGMESVTTDSCTVDLRNVTMAKMKEQGELTTRIRVRATIKLKDEFFTPGMFLRVHLPVPAACDQQQDIRIEKVWPEGGMIAPETASQRTVCWQENLPENQEFMVEYSYLHTAKYQDAYNGTGIAGTYDFDVQEQEPHIVFSPYIQSLCAELTEGITDPLRKARAFYDFITKNMYYTYMPEYITLESLAENCARNYTGDCGIFALLFLTLCRCAGIPAQWQSGLAVEPDYIGGHDWVRFYVEPYGWIFADASYGVSSMRAENEERRQFYFGNLDPYRLVANSAFQMNFTIPKEQWRADPYDNQRGEMESADRGYSFSAMEQNQTILLCEEV